MKEPIAWGCKTCLKFDWKHIKKQLAKPEHIAYRGCDIGGCNGKMIPLYDLTERELSLLDRFSPVKSEPL